MTLWDFIKIIFSNTFFGYDIIIFVLFGVEILYYRRTLQAVKNLENKLHPILDSLDKNSIRSTIKLLDNSRQYARKLRELREKEEKNYSVFVNITGIFPLLGILGTVIALLNLINDNQNITGNFYGALTSTFWGLVFAIIFKYIDGYLAARVETNDKYTTIYLESCNDGDLETVYEK